MIKPIDYMQTDRRWASHKYATKGERATIKTSGCGITCAAMVIATLADSSVTPVTTAEWSMAHGYKAYRQGTYYSYFKPQLAAYGIECTQLNGSTIYHGSGKAQSTKVAATAAVKAGDWVICCMGKGDWTSSGHFILWYGIDSSGYALIMDPNSTRASRRRAPISKLMYQCKFCWRVETEESMTQEKFNQMFETAIADWMNGRASLQPDDWSKPARDWGYKNGIMTGGRYKSYATREELMQTLYAFGLMLYNSMKTEDTAETRDNKKEGKSK